MVHSSHGQEWPARSEQGTIHSVILNVEARDGYNQPDEEVGQGFVRRPDLEEGSILEVEAKDVRADEVGQGCLRPEN